MNYHYISEDDLTRAREQAEDHAAEMAHEFPKDDSQTPGLLIWPCEEMGAHGGDCFNVCNRDGEVLSPHASYSESYFYIYGEYPADFDPFLDAL